MWYVLAFLILLFGKTDVAIFFLLFAIAKEAFPEKQVKEDD